jgi:aspartate kinase
MKFGGTSVGKPERMHQVSQLITKNTEPTIVVLSALSGTTNALVGLSDLLGKSDKAGVTQHIENLEKHYRAFIVDLLKSDALIAKANSIIDEHFEFLKITQRISLSDALNRDILAQGELMSTKLFSLYLEQENIDHALIPALDFMCLDANEEPD